MQLFYYYLLIYLDIMQLATQNQHATKPYHCYCYNHAACHTASSMELLPCKIPYSFKHAVVAMQNATQLQTCSCCHAECHTASHMQLLPCRMPHSFKHAAVAMQNATQLHTCSCCHAECHTASNMQLLPCRMPHSFTHAAVAMQNATQFHTCSCCHAECHTASNMQLLPCRMPHSFKHAAVAMQNAAQPKTCSCYYAECCTATPSSCCCHTVTLGHSPLSVTKHCHAIMQHLHAVMAYNLQHTWHPYRNISLQLMCGKKSHAICHIAAADSCANLCIILRFF